MEAFMMGVNHQGGPVAAEGGGLASQDGRADQGGHGSQHDGRAEHGHGGQIRHDDGRADGRADHGQGGQLRYEDDPPPPGSSPMGGLIREVVDLIPAMAGGNGAPGEGHGGTSAYDPYANEGGQRVYVYNNDPHHNGQPRGNEVVNYPQQGHCQNDGGSQPVAYNPQGGSSQGQQANNGQQPVPTVPIGDQTQPTKKVPTVKATVPKQGGGGGLILGALAFGGALLVANSGKSDR